MLRFIILSITATRITFTPQAVEEEQPPTKKRQKSIITQNEGHRLKSAVAHPVVVIIEATWNVASLKA